MSSPTTLDATASGAAPTGTGPPAPADARPTIFVPGELIAGRYQVVRFIARGGMGEVYEADDRELGVRLAVKTIQSSRIGDPDSVQRLKGEILAARRIAHSNVVRLYDVGFHVLDDQREVAFISM